MRALALVIAFVLATSACAVGQSVAPEARTGPDPMLPPPERNLFPTVRIAPATGWPADAAPIPAAGLRVTRFATGLQHPRWLLVLPNGDVLVAESNAPPGKSGVKGIKGKVMGSVMKRAGAGVPSADRITLLRDVDGDGIAEIARPFLTGLHSPFGMALIGDSLYVANADALVVVPYRAGDTRITAQPRRVVALPGKGDELNHHWTKSLIPSADGRLLYVGVGSNSNVGENGMAVETNRAAVLEVNPVAGTMRVFASGLRNPVGLGFAPRSGALWAVVNERDELGNDLVPDYLTEVREGGFYGWPYSYYGQNLDPRVKPLQPDLVAKAIKPDYALGSHVAPLGLAFSPGGVWSGGRAGAVIGLHGSWNRRPATGYEVVFVPFSDGRPAGPMQSLLTGFLDADGNARGRPVGIAVQADGAILVADDVGNAVWRAAPARDP
ncbi:PQQ-dependent sugar dehydrogenase [Thermomonas carbonis]|uniref:Sorbosone dehydrogenase family protein n=1 Tax=Thermomonas carbonis TaxID=1463158 RepID=A0A7G9STL1_9GAMM|nr:sorbosone dehydrogenase family protein [Thermomonas carbonis]QNN71186.1 sorbosone dehydrogenase family protein [Thermomonas carbonis]